MRLPLLQQLLLQRLRRLLPLRLQTIVIKRQRLWARRWRCICKSMILRILPRLHRGISITSPDDDSISIISIIDSIISIIIISIIDSGVIDRKVVNVIPIRG